MNLHQSFDRLSKVFSQPAGLPFAWSRKSFVFCGFETRKAEMFPRDMRMKNAGLMERYVTFHYTLAGEGIIDSETKSHVMTPGSLFLVGVPSDLIYYLPKHSKSWTFSYMTISHPYIVQRIEQAISSSTPVWSVDCRQNCIQLAFDLIVAHHQRAFSDQIAEEQALFLWMYEFFRYSRLNSGIIDPSSS